MLRSQKARGRDLVDPDPREFVSAGSGYEDEASEDEAPEDEGSGGPKGDEGLDAPFVEEGWRRGGAGSPVLQGVGRVFITVGLLVLSFLAYQVWGTNAVTGKSQQALASDLRDSWKVASSGDSRAPSAANPPPTGTGIAMIQIPKIGVENVVVEGVDDDSLKKGPGHYPETAFPGEAGNVVISGHRTTYGAPFYRVDELNTGDEITLKDASGTYKYKVTEKKVVNPTDLSVVVPSTDARLTLTTCHPRFSARQRLIIVATLEGPPR